MIAPAGMILGSVLAPGFAIVSRWTLRWHTVALALIVPVCLLALAEARLRGRR